MFVLAGGTFAQARCRRGEDLCSNGSLKRGGLKVLTNIRGNAGHSVGVLRIRLIESRVGWKAKLGNAVLLI
jgi:hypothetical protein